MLPRTPDNRVGNGERTVFDGNDWQAVYTGPIRIVEHPTGRLTGYIYRLDIHQIAELKLNPDIAHRFVGFSPQDYRVQDFKTYYSKADLKCVSTRIFTEPKPELNQGKNFDWRAYLGWIRMDDGWYERLQIPIPNQISLEVNHPWYSAALNQLNSELATQFGIEYPHDYLLVQLNKSKNVSRKQGVSGDGILTHTLQYDPSSREFIIPTIALTEHSHLAYTLCSNDSMFRYSLYWREMGGQWQKGQGE